MSAAVRRHDWFSSKLSGGAFSRQSGSRQSGRNTNHRSARLAGTTGHSVEIWSVNKQGRWRSITPAALPCPDIKIGFRHPVRPSWPVQARRDVIHFTIGQKSSSRGRRAAADPLSFWFNAPGLCGSRSMEFGAAGRGRRARRLRRLSARERLPQAVDGARQTPHLIRQPFVVVLLRRR
jgi:hypothetical protein